MTEKPLIHIDPAAKREGLAEFSRDDACQYCGGITEQGFGLAGGGYGAYAFCTNCNVVTSKSEVSE